MGIGRLETQRFLDGRRECEAAVADEDEAVGGEELGAGCRFSDGRREGVEVPVPGPGGGGNQLVRAALRETTEQLAG
eukprot:1300268-Prorocentrum_lima.AAC.1